MASHLYPIISERVTNLTVDQADLVHCPICGYILWKPVACNSCGNSFCFPCIQIWLSEQQEQNDISGNLLALIRCPFNCSPYQQRKSPPLLISILSKLTIECRNKSYGCEEIIPYEQLEKHEEEFCPFQIVQCPGCKINMFKEFFIQNEHLLNCLYVEMECQRCQSVFKRKDEHDLFDCMEKRISLLKEDMLIIQEKFSKILDIQSKKIDSLTQKIQVIEDRLANFNNQYKPIEKKINFIPHWIQLFNLRSFEKREIFIGMQLLILAIFILFIYIRNLFW